jgi:acetoin utilization protein AcuC
VADTCFRGDFLTHRSIAPAVRGALPVLVGSAYCRATGFGRNHPLAIPRVATVLQLCEELGWLEAASFRVAAAAEIEDLVRFHERDYVEALREADTSGRVTPAARERYGFGTLENPLFPGVFARAATAVGGSMLAAELALEGRVVFHPAGGTHHGRPGRASGFCYFNDPVFAIMAFLQRGVQRVLYVDLDAHHGDGVQDAFAGNPAVLTISVHEGGRWPHTGPAEDRGGGSACNLPVPPGFNDSELHFLFDTVVLPRADEFAPEAVVITCGTDALAGDPLSRMALSNVALWSAVERVVGMAAPAVVLGGGGYNPWTLARCWTGLWGRLSGFEIPATLPVVAQRMLADLRCDLVDDEDVRAEWLTTLFDSPNVGPVRASVRALATAQHTRRLHELA